MVHRNSANIACTFRIYICLRLCDRDCCSAADGSGSCHAPAPSYFEEMTRCRRQKHCLETVPTCSMTDGNGSYHGLAPSFFEEMTSKTLPATTRQPYWFIEIPQISRIPSAFTSVYICAITTVVPRLIVAAVAMHPHRRILEMTRCRRKKLHWR